MLSASHLLWTLFLTATIFMLFNAGQTANRALSAKLDELSASSRCRVGLTASTMFMPLTSPPRFFLQRSRVAGRGRRATAAGDPAELADSDSYVKPSGSVASLEQGADDLPAGQAALQPTSEHDLSHYAFDWLRDLLRMPVDLVKAFFGILLGA